MKLEHFQVRYLNLLAIQCPGLIAKFTGWIPIYSVTIQEIPRRFQRKSNMTIWVSHDKTPVSPKKNKTKKIPRHSADQKPADRVIQWSGQPPGPEWDSRWAARPLQGPRPRTTVNCNYSWLSAGGFELALASIKYLEEGCHAPCTHHFSWNGQDQHIVGMSKLL